MNPPTPQPSIWKRQFLPELSLIRLFGWRMIRRYLFCLACLATLIAIFYAEENWRGRRAWRNYKIEQEAKGTTFDRRSFIPPTVPDDQNFAMTPFFAPMLDFEPGTQVRRDTNWNRSMDRFRQLTDAVLKGSWKSSRPHSNSWVMPPEERLAWYVGILDAHAKLSKETNFSNTTKTSLPTVAAEILDYLSAAKPSLDEIRSAARRPYARFNIRYENDDPAAIMLPHLASMKSLCTVLQLRASAELALDGRDAAFDDVNLIFQIMEAVRNEPILISQLVRFSEFQLALQPIADGLAAHQWSEPQLRALQQRCESINFCADGRRALDAERVIFAGGIVDYLRHLPFRDKMQFASIIDSSDSSVSGSQLEVFWTGVLFVAAPDGWLDLEQLNYDRFSQQYILPAIYSQKVMASPALAAKAFAAIKEHHAESWPAAFLHHRFFTRLMTVSPNLARKIARAQTAADLAAVACALEQHHLANGRFPETLEALVPQYMPQLPHDIITGGPLHYRLTGIDHFILYSVGWNQTDDGGIVLPDKPSVSDAPDRASASDQGDWVWQ